MASQYNLKQNRTGGYDVFMRDLYTRAEFEARFNHMVRECGFSEQEAAAEIAAMVHQFHKKNMTDNNSFEISAQFIWDTMDPGDVIFIENRPFFVQEMRSE